MISLALNLPVPTDLIMTGELRLEGRVFSVGSVEEKAAKDGGYQQIFLPVDNEEQWDKEEKE